MTFDPSSTLIVITGPTAVGKTSLSIHIAQHLKAEIVSADSRQFYREMKIGTARPTDAEQAAVPHHFIGHLSVTDDYNVSKFETDALHKLESLFASNRFAILTGGSGLYIRAVCHGIDDMPDPDPSLRETLNQQLQSEGISALRNQLKELDPEFYSTVDLANPKRILRALEVCLTTGQSYSSLRKNSGKIRSFRVVKIGLQRDKADLDCRINERVDEMIRNGLVSEARELYPLRQMNALNTVGYRELFTYFDGEKSLDHAVAKIKTNTRRYAKRQMTWFRKEQDINWFEAWDETAVWNFIRDL
jgi:tRNA dimethylallyltransferase